MGIATKWSFDKCKVYSVHVLRGKAGGGGGGGGGSGGRVCRGIGGEEVRRRGRSEKT